MSLSFETNAVYFLVRFDGGGVGVALSVKDFG